MEKTLADINYLLNSKKAQHDAVKVVELSGKYKRAQCKSKGVIDVLHLVRVNMLSCLDTVVV
jgi:hypothetical protein